MKTNVLYLITFDRPNQEVAVKGIRNKILKTSILGGHEVQNRKLGGAPWAGLPGVLWIKVPEMEIDADATVIKVELEGPLDLYSGAGDNVTFNQ